MRSRSGYSLKFEGEDERGAREHYRRKESEPVGHGERIKVLTSSVFMTSISVDDEGSYPGYRISITHLLYEV